MRQEPRNLELSVDGQIALMASEGIVPAIYLDSVGVETFGIGVTRWGIGEEAFEALPWAMPAGADLERMIAFAVDQFDITARKYERHVREAVRVPLAQHEYDALVHFCYNIGEPNFSRSKLLRNLNGGNYTAAGETGFHGWLKPPELRGRRDKERAIFLERDYGGQRVPIFKTDGKGKLRGVTRTLTRGQAAAMIGATAPQAPAQPVAPVPAPTVPPVATSPAPAPAPGLPGEILALIEETERGGMESNTNVFALITGLGAPLAAAAAWLETVDPIVAAAAIAAAAVGFAIYLSRSRGRKSRKGRDARAAAQRLGLL